MDLADRLQPHISPSVRPPEHVILPFMNTRRQPRRPLTTCRGRNIVVDPLPASGPINFLAYPVLEVGDQLVRADVTFSFVRETVQ